MRVTVVPVAKAVVKTKSIKWEGISSLSNFEITAADVKAFKAYGIGAGNFRSWTSFSGMFNQEVVRRNYSCSRQNGSQSAILYWFHSTHTLPICSQRACMVILDNKAITPCHCIIYYTLINKNLLILVFSLRNTA